MKKLTKIITLVLLLATIGLMFAPIATFSDNSASSMAADIEKQEERVKSAQDKLDRWVSEGKKSADDIEKQKAKVQKEQDKLDGLLAEQASADSAESTGLTYSLLPGKLPGELEIDIQKVNESKGYQPNIDAYYVCVWTALALLALAVVLLLLAGNKLVSKLYTFSVFAHLAGIVMLVYSILRLKAFPIALPYGNADLNDLVVWLMLGCSLVSFMLSVRGVYNSKRSMIYVFCILLCALAILPFWIMIVNATRSSLQIQSGMSLLPSSFLANNWKVLQTKNFDILVGFKNSAIIAFGSTILGVYFSAMTAYGFKVYDFKGRKFLYGVVMAIIMIPGQVTGTGFYMFMYRLGLTNNFLPLIIPAICSASTVFFFRQYLEANFQVSLVEAARIDGAREFYTFNCIVVPIMIPAMATMGIMAVIGSWNNYLTPLMLLSDPTMKTLPMMVKELRGDIYRTEYGSIYLGLTLTALPLMIVYFAFSKYIIAGVAVGGVKE